MLTYIYFYSAEIDDEGYGKLAELVTDNKNRDNALLILVTSGGSANAAYQIARLFQKTYSEGNFVLCVPSYCKSAGTLIALGAHTLVMDTFSELGPLDVQLFKQDEIGTRKSGLLSRSAFQSLEDASFDLFESLMLKIKRRSGDLISFRLASDVSARMTAELMAQVYGQISPDIIGSDFRDLQVALLYRIRLVKYSQNTSPMVVKHLVEHYPSHDFIIDNEEAASLFNEVEYPSPALYKVIGLLGDAAYNEDRSGIVLGFELCADQPEEGADAGEVGGADGSEGPGKPTGMDADREKDRPCHPEAPRGPEAGSQSLRSARKRRRQI